MIAISKTMDGGWSSDLVSTFVCFVDIKKLGFEGVWAELMGYFSIRPRPENCLAPAHHFVATTKHPTTDLLCVSVGFQLSSLCYMPNYFLKSWINFGRDHEFSKVISYRERIDPAGSCRTLYLGILVKILSHY